MVEERPGGAIGGDGRKLVVCCVEGDVAPLQPALDVLGTRGIEITVLQGQDVRPAALTEHARRHGPEAAYVLVRLSEASTSDPATFESALRSAGVPAARISALVVDWRDPMALVEHVATPPRRTTLVAAPRTTTGTIVAPPPKRETTGPRAIVGPPPKRETTGPRTVVPPAPTTASSRPRLLSVRVDPPATPIAVADAETTRLEPAIEAPTPAPPTPAPRSIPDPPIALPPAIAHVPVAAPEITEPALRVTSSVTLERAASGLRTVTAALRPIAQRTASRSRRAASWLTSSRPRLLAAAGVAVAACVGIAVLSVDWPAPQRMTDASKEAHAVAASPIAPRVGEAAAPSGTSVPAPRADSPAEAPPPVVVETTETRPTPTVRATRGVGMFRGIVFAPVHAPKRRFRAAQQQCAALNTAAEQGWRLPTLGELHVLAVGHAIDRGVYWSGTEADGFGKHALVWSEKKSAAMPITKAWRGGRALCVRDAAG